MPDPARQHPSLAPAAAQPEGSITIRGARTHNLRAIDLELPRNKLVVLTGVSGSGKSSLAIDTLHAEGQYRFLEAVAATHRQWLDALPRPRVNAISGLPPTVAIGQNLAFPRGRSTLATLTGLHDYLRLLYARAGMAHCPKCGREVCPQTPQAVVDAILALEAGRKVMLLAPLVSAQRGTHRQLFERIVRDGFVRARVDGAIVDAASPPELAASRPHTIELVVDRVVVKEGLRPRLQESVLLALKHGQDRCIVSREAGAAWEDRLFSCRYACLNCNEGLCEIEPRTFNFNSPQGACPVCTGTGMAPVASSSARQASLARKPRSGHIERAGTACAAAPAPCPDCQGARLGAVARAVTFLGMPLQGLLALPVAQAAQWVSKARAALESIERGEISSQQPAAPATGGPPIGLPDLAGVSPEARVVGLKLLPEILARLEFLWRLDLSYLALDRAAGTLSGGELERARLAAALGSGLRGVCYILDEPTVGLHARDTQRLLETLCALRDAGNTVIVVEHDIEFMARADLLVDLGPGAGNEGGRIVASGTPSQVAAQPGSATGLYLSRHLAAPPPELPGPQRRTPRKADMTCAIEVNGAKRHNLRDLSVCFPLGVLTAVTGVSGSGKSTLVMGTLVPGVRGSLAAASSAGEPRGKEATPEVPVEPRPAVDVPDCVSRLVVVDQLPIGRSGRSNPATATGMWDPIRALFARARDARLRGMKAAQFSFNSPGGRCETCHGHGSKGAGVRYLPEVTIICPSCRGARFNRRTLEVKYRGLSVADVLALRVDEAARLFADVPAVSTVANTLVEVGLGYLALGQPAQTLSGGEAQRIKLARELCLRPEGRALYVLDEPTTGLHPADVARLLQLLHGLVEQGHTVVVIEHQLDVIAAADYVIDLGPEGGNAGGALVVQGTPGEVACHPASHTGRALARWFAGPAF